MAFTIRSRKLLLAEKRLRARISEQWTFDDRAESGKAHVELAVDFVSVSVAKRYVHDGRKPIPVRRRKSTEMEVDIADKVNIQEANWPSGRTLLRENG